MWKQKSEVIEFVLHKSTGTALSEGKPIINSAFLCLCAIIIIVCEVSTVCQTNQSSLYATSDKHMSKETERREGLI